MTESDVGDVQLYVCLSLRDHVYIFSCVPGLVQAGRLVGHDASSEMIYHR